MRLVSIDIETTGLDPDRCSVLEIGAVDFDPQAQIKSDAGRWQFFDLLIKHSFVQGELYALQMNQEILAELAGVKRSTKRIVSAATAVILFASWLKDQGYSEENKATLCGKNVGSFDLQFLRRLPGWRIKVDPLLNHRMLDVGSVFFDPGSGVPSLAKCASKVNHTPTREHRALDDACTVATVLTRVYSEAAS